MAQPSGGNFLVFEKVLKKSPGGLSENFFKNSKMTSRRLRHARPGLRRSYDGKNTFLHFLKKYGIRHTKALTCTASDIAKNRYFS